MLSALTLPARAVWFGAFAALGYALAEVPGTTVLRARLEAAIA